MVRKCVRCVRRHGTSWSITSTGILISGINGRAFSLNLPGICRTRNVMIIEKLNIYNLKIPFSRTIKHRLHTRNVTESIIVVIKDSNGHQGVGEGTPRNTSRRDIGKKPDGCQTNLQSDSRPAIRNHQRATCIAERCG